MVFIYLKCSSSGSLTNNKNIDIKFSEHDTIPESHSSGNLKVERLEKKSLGAIQPKSLNRISKISKGHLCLQGGDH